MRPRARRRTARGAAVLAGLLGLALALSALTPASGFASTTINVLGSWNAQGAGGGPYTMDFTSENCSTGAVSGTASAPINTESGSLSGNQITLDEYYGGYHSHIVATVSADGTSMSGTFTDSSHTAGWSATRSGTAPANPCSGTTTTTTTTTTPVTTTTTSTTTTGPVTSSTTTTTTGPATPNMAVACSLSLDTYADTCTATVGDASANPTVPTGAVHFASANGGVFAAGDTCSLSPVPDSPGIASCSVQFDPAANQIPQINAAYPGDGTHGPASAATTTPGFSVDGSAISGSLVQFCSSIYVKSCTGLLPAPQPVTVCVSAWQNCNGFGGAKSAKPGTIDMSGLPTAVSTPVACPKSAARSSNLRRALDAPSNSGSSANCRWVDYANTDSPTRTKADDDLNRTARVILFTQAVNREKALATGKVVTLIQDLSSPTNWKGTAPPRVLIALLVGAINNANTAFGNAEVRDEPVDTSVDVVVLSACDQLADDYVHTLCTSALTVVQAGVLDGLGRLADLKHQLQLDGTASGGTQQQIRFQLSQVGRRPIRHARLLLGGGSATVAAGHRGRLTLRLTAAARRELRALQRRRVRSIRATIHLSVQRSGVSTQKTIRVTLRLIKPPRHHR